MPDFAYPPPSGQSPFPNLRPGPDPGLLPGPGFTGDRDPLPTGPTPWPSVPLPGSQPTNAPFAAALDALARGDRLAQPDNTTFGVDLGKLNDLRALRDAYADVPIGNFQYPGQGFPGAAPPGYDPNVEATTVGALGLSDRGTPAGNLADERLRALEQARVMQNFKHFAGNLPTVTLPFGLGSINPRSMVGLPTPPQQPGGYPTMPGGGPLPYDPSLPVGGGNPSPGMPGSTTSTSPIPPWQWPNSWLPPLPQPGQLPPQGSGGFIPQPGQMPQQGYGGFIPQPGQMTRP